jgi:hypothetical protein
MDSKLLMPCHAMPYYAMPCHAMPCYAKRRDVHGRLLYPKHSYRDRCSAWTVERGERRLVVHADNARSHSAKVPRADWDDKFLRIAPDPHSSPDLAPSDFLLLSISKPPSRIAIRECRWTSFGSPKNSGRNQCSHFGSGFPGVSVSTDWTEKGICFSKGQNHSIVTEGLSLFVHVSVACRALLWIHCQARMRCPWKERRASDQISGQLSRFTAIQFATSKPFFFLQSTIMYMGIISLHKCQTLRIRTWITMSVICSFFSSCRMSGQWSIMG